jgi:DNA-binding NarL/FixJ family response regulator
MCALRAEPIRVMVVDDHQLVRDGLRAMMAHRSELEIVGAVATGEEALALAAESAPDVALIDVNLRGESGLDLCRRLRETRPEIAVVCLTVYDEEQYLFEALRAGARGFLLKRITPGALVEALAAVLDGETVVDPLLSGRVARTAAAGEAHGLFWPGIQYGLTRREAEMLDQVCEGLSNREIATRSYVSEETVKSHLKSIYRKLSVTDRTEAVALALREGLAR